MGTQLPTTPNIDAFARNGTVFTNFYSASTFTTPSVATIMTGVYPSESHVYQTAGPGARGDTPGISCRTRCEPPAMPPARSSSNPFAYYFAGTA